ncbi:uncharacterized protein ACBT57_024663 isoform 3-T8 [Dama dama]
MKHKLESRLPGEISITSDMQMTPPLWQKVKESSLIGYYSSHGQSHEQVQEDHEAASFIQIPVACISFVDPNPPSPLTVNKFKLASHRSSLRLSSGHSGPDPTPSNAA